MSGRKGRSGRKPLSAAEHLLRGTYRRDRHGDAALEAPGATAGLDPEAMARLGDGLGPAGLRLVEDHLAGFSEWDPTSLALLRAAAQAADRVREIQIQIRSDGGLLVTGARGGRVAHPLLAAERKAAAQLLAALRAIDFAAAPAARPAAPAAPSRSATLFPLIGGRFRKEA